LKEILRESASANFGEISVFGLTAIKVSQLITDSREAFSVIGSWFGAEMFW
jgi:hypothetical protein